MLKDLGVHISQNTKIDKAVLGVRVDASAGRGHSSTGEEPGGFATLPLQQRGYKSSRKMASSKSQKILCEPRTRPILEPNILTEDRPDEHWRDVIATSVREELESHCEQITS